MLNTEQEKSIHWLTEATIARRRRSPRSQKGEMRGWESREFYACFDVPKLLPLIAVTFLRQSHTL